MKAVQTAEQFSRDSSRELECSIDHKIHKILCNRLKSQACKSQLKQALKTDKSHIFGSRLLRLKSNRYSWRLELIRAITLN